ncbi:MAG: HupE/UreJ family protein [Myxococcota bacterium]|nr:HupE/UreJ family protein [Myxococcota bacterium]
MNKQIFKIMFLWTSIGLSLGTAKPVQAHEVGVSAGYYDFKAKSPVAYISIAQVDLLRIFPRIDADLNGDISPSEIAAQTSTSTFVRSWSRGIISTTDAEECETKLVSAKKADEDGLLIELRFSCGNSFDQLKLRTVFVKRFPANHRHLVRVNLPGGLYETTMGPKKTTLLVNSAAQTVESNKTGRFIDLFVFGLEHIVTGYDHLLFLLGLILVAMRFRELVFLVTAFTVGHSITLAVAALNVWTPNSGIVETLIAASIVYIGAENIAVKKPKHRWYLTLLFGLVHGFGFGGMLKLHGMSSDQMILDLLGFNLGVEIGQLFCLTVAVPILAIIRRKNWFEKQVLLGVNILVIFAGLYWLQERLRGIWS